MVILRRYNETTEQDDILKDSGIIEAKRYLILFVDSTEPPNKRNFGKAIQINISTSETRYLVFDDVLNRENGTLTRMDVYVYSAVLPMGSDYPKMGEFILNDAYVNRKETNHTDHMTRNEDVSIYDSTFAINYAGADDLLRDSMYGLKININDPQYYTNQHQMSLTRNVNDIREEIIKLSYSGDELIDMHTEIQVLKIEAFDSFKDKLSNLQNRIEDERFDICSSSSALDSMFFPKTETMIQKAIFTYDTNMGKKIEGGFVPHQKYISKESVQQDIMNIFNDLEIIGSTIKEEHGDVRIMYYPDAIGDKINILYKDYNDDNQPFLNDLSSDSGTLLNNNVTQIADELRTID